MRGGSIRCGYCHEFRVSGDVSTDQGLSLRKRGRIAAPEDRVRLDEAGLRLRGRFGTVVDGGDGAGRHAGAAVDALLWMDVEDRRLVELGFVLAGVNAIDGADVDARSVFRVDARISNDEGHFVELTQKRQERKAQEMSERKVEELSEEEKRANVVRLAFGGSEERFAEFIRVIREEIPQHTRVVLRGSAVTGYRWKDGAPFDADGPGTSDLDLTLVGDAVIGLFTVTGFFVPGVHSRPLSEEDPNIAPDLIPLRETLMTMTGRPVNIQASRELVIQFRGDLLGQPYLVLIDDANPSGG